MLAITAIIRAKTGHERAVRDALIEVARHARSNEPGTIGYFLTQDLTDPCVFTTYERFTDKSAMDLHNNSATVGRFLEIAKPMLDGDVAITTGSELV